MRKLLALALFALATPIAAHDGVSHDPNLPQATKDQIHAVARAVERYKDFDVAKAEGWTKFGDDEALMGEHWSPPKKLGWPDLQGSDARIDWSKPANLMYTDIAGKKTLTGVAFVVRLAEGEAMPEGFAGASDRWHAHDFEKAINAATETRPLLRWLANSWLDSNYRNKGDNRGRLAMVHAWVTLPNPDGIFADYNRLVPYLKHGLPESYATGGTVQAARGLELATPKGCEAATGGRLWIADASKKSTKAIQAACTTAASEVRAYLTEHRAHAAMVNAFAEQAYARFDAVWTSALTPEQRARIAAMSEHGAHGDNHSPPIDRSLDIMADPKAGHDH